MGMFRSSARFFKDIVSRIHSLWVSSMTAVPYLFSTGEFRKEVTEYYPDPVSAKTAEDLPPRTRGFLSNDIDRCTGCRECEKTCPVSCIKIGVEPGIDQAQVWVSLFSIDNAKCIFCGLCVEICPPRSLTHTKKYEGGVTDLTQLVTSFGKGSITQEQRVKWQKMRLEFRGARNLGEDVPRRDSHE